MSPFTDFSQVPLVCGIEDAARVLNTSPRSLYRKLEAGKFVPGVMPREGKTSPWQFSKKKLQDYVEGGYANQLRVIRRRA